MSTDALWEVFTWFSTFFLEPCSWCTWVRSISLIYCTSTRFIPPRNSLKVSKCAHKSQLGLFVKVWDVLSDCLHSSRWGKQKYKDIEKSFTTAFGKNFFSTTDDDKALWDANDVRGVLNANLCTKVKCAFSVKQCTPIMTNFSPRRRFQAETRRAKTCSCACWRNCDTLDFANEMWRHTDGWEGQQRCSSGGLSSSC